MRSAWQAGISTSTPDLAMQFISSSVQGTCQLCLAAAAGQEFKPYFMLHLHQQNLSRQSRAICVEPGAHGVLRMLYMAWPLRCLAGLDKLSSFYFEREDDFPEVRDFVKEQDRT
jgi:hypothetical protein